jgi:hypothetical protein
MIGHRRQHPFGRATGRDVAPFLCEIAESMCPITKSGSMFSS